MAMKTAQDLYEEEWIPYLTQTEGHGKIPCGIRDGRARVKSMARVGDIAILTTDLWESVLAITKDHLLFGRLDNRGYSFDYYKRLETEYEDTYFEGLSRVFNCTAVDPTHVRESPILRNLRNELSNPIASVEEEMDFRGEMIQVPITILDPNRVRIERYTLSAFDFANFCYKSCPNMVGNTMFLGNDVIGKYFPDIRYEIRRSKHPVFKEFNDYMRRFYRNWEKEE